MLPRLLPPDLMLPHSASEENETRLLMDAGLTPCSRPGC